MTAADIQDRLRSFASEEKARHLSRFFKTGPGQYGEGDAFLGVMVPQTRRVAREFREAPLAVVRKLLRSKWHEERLLAILLLVHKFEHGDDVQRKKIFDLYLANTRHINNWDLVDLSAHRIVGSFLDVGSRSLLYQMARSRSLWERRMSIIATFAYIRKNEFGDALDLARELLSDEEDLIHKATGWVLREVGKKDAVVLEGFLQEHHGRMPRTALRYAIERLPPQQRTSYLRRIG